jgi:hypothetical protein
VVNGHSDVTIDGMYRAMKMGAEEVMERFTKPDDDWAAVVFLLSGRIREVQIIDLDPHFFFDNRTKDALVLVLMTAIKKERAEAIGTIFSAWSVEGEAAQESVEHNTRPRDHPQRKEMLIITLVEPGNVRICWAEILRSETETPRLSEWQEDETTQRLEGRFIQPLQEALKEVRDG